MTNIETKKELTENEALILNDNDVTRAEFPSVKVEPETEEPVKEWDETVEAKKESEPVWKESELEAMGYKGKVTKRVKGKNGKREEVTKEINSRSEYKKEKNRYHSPVEVFPEEVIKEELSPRDIYYKENPSVKEKRNNLKYKTGRYFKENISKIDGVWDTVNSFEMDDFEDCFKVSLDGKAVKLNIWKDREAAKSRLVYFLKKTTLGSMAPETIADSVVYKNPNMILDEKTINNIRANIKYAFRTTFDKLKEDWYEVWDREEDFEKAFWSN